MKYYISPVLIFCIVFFSCGGDQQQSSEASEVQQEMEEFKDGDVEHGNISSKCSEDLVEFEKLLAEYGALIKREKEGNPIDDATKTELEERTKTKMMALAKNSMMFADPDCAVAFSNAQRRFNSYIMGVLVEEE